MRELARLGAAVAALLVILRSAAIAGPSRAVTVATGIAALAVVGGLTLWRDGLVTGSAVVLAAHYVVALGYGDVAVDLGAPVSAALLVAYLDLADLAAALPPDRRVDGALLRASLRRTLGVLTIGACAATAVFVLAAVPWPATEWVRAAGALGVAAVVAVPLILLRRAQ